MKKRPTSRRKSSDTPRPLPDAVDEWLEEIQLAVADASGEPFSRAVRKRSALVNLFHLAPLVCLKFRGPELRGKEADQVTKFALANYVANSNPDRVDRALERRPLMAFVLCYVTSHLALELIDEETAQAVLMAAEERLED